MRTILFVGTAAGASDSHNEHVIEKVLSTERGIPNFDNLVFLMSFFFMRSKEKSNLDVGVDGEVLKF